MFPQMIDRIGSILGLSNEEAMSSDLVKELCIDLVNGHLLIINSEKKKFSSIKNESHFAKQSASQKERLVIQ